jgi:hypothetical protein
MIWGFEAKKRFFHRYLPELMCFDLHIPPLFPVLSLTEG